MERFYMNTTDGAQYTTNFSQVMAYPRRDIGLNSSQHCMKLTLVQVKVGESLTIKSPDGNIQHIPGPADVPLMLPSGTLPLIHLPPGFISQVVEENGIRKITSVPQTVDYPIIIPLPPPPVSHYTPAPPMYPPAPYIQEAVPEQLLLPPPLQLPPPQPPLPPVPPLPLPLPPPPAAPFIYPEMHETYRSGRTNNNRSNQRAAKMKKKKKELRVRRQRNIISVPLNKTNDTSNADDDPCICTLTYTSSTNTEDNTSSICAENNDLNINIADNIHSIDNAPSNVSTDDVPSAATSDTVLHSSSMNYTPKASTSDSTPVSPSIDSTPRSPIADNAPSSSNTDGAHVEISHGKKQSAMENRNIEQKLDGKPSKSPSSNDAEKECGTEYGKLSCFSIENLVVSDIQTRSAVVAWKPQVFEKCDHTKCVTYELAISDCGTSGYKKVYTITTKEDSAHKIVSEMISFTTPGCEPDPPLAPKLINRSTSSLNLQWKGSNDNGSKVNSFLLEWDEGKGEVFKSCYVGTMKQHEVFKLNACTKYSFRLAAENEFGLSDFSEIVAFHTSGTTLPTPLPPKLKEAGIGHVSLEWCALTNMNLNDNLTYVVEMEEAGSGLGFKPKYSGQALSCTLRDLQRCTTYKFRIFAYNTDGKSEPSEEVKYATSPDKPGFPKKPYIKGKIHAHRVKIGWKPPDDDGGTYISSYSLEVSENLDVNSWNIIYSGTAREFLYDHLQPGTTYKLRVFCTSPIGQSQPSDILTIQTPTLSPASYYPLPLKCKAKSKETNIQYDNPHNGNSGALVNVKKAKDIHNDTEGHFGSEGRHIFGSHSTNCEIVPGPRPPSECGIPVLTCKGSNCVAVSWNIPVCNGAKITNYRLEWGQMEESMQLIYTGPCLSYKVRGLVPATTYFCRVQAVNTVGVGMFGGTGTITTPATVPAIVPVLHQVENKVPAKLASSCIAVQWEEPNCHGSPITGYRIEYGDRKILNVDRVTECLLKNLRPDTTYKVRIQAINHYGLSPFSQSVRMKTKPLLPEPPHLDCEVYGHQSLKLKWGNSSRQGSLSNIRGYNLLMGVQSGRFSVIYHGPGQNHIVQRLSEYTRYEFKIQACNEAGKGALSDIYTFTTTKTPPAILKAPKLQQVNNHICEVKWESLKPMKGDPIVYNLQVISEKRTDLIYKGPDTSFSFSNFLTNAQYHFRVRAGRQYQNSAGLQEVWGQYSPKALLSPSKPWPGNSKSRKVKGESCPRAGKKKKFKIHLSVDTFIVILLVGFALAAILCAVTMQYFLTN